MHFNHYKLLKTRSSLLYTNEGIRVSDILFQLIRKHAVSIMIQNKSGMIFEINTADSQRCRFRLVDLGRL